MTRNCIVVDLDRCIGCFSCEVSCKVENEITVGEQWNKVIIEGPFGDFPNIEQYWLPTMCQQCENAPCVEVCPTGATYRDPETNVVLIDEEVCIGCQSCMMACPYDARSLNVEKNTVEKCTLCQGRTSKGEQPACVANCCAEARFYGDLDDPESDASKALAAAEPESIHRLTDEGNGPSTAYILSSKIATWRSGE